MTNPTEPQPMPDTDPAGPAEDGEAAPADDAPASAATSPADSPTVETADVPSEDSSPDVAADAPSGESSSDTEVAPAANGTPVGGTVPAWWRWVGRHRKPVGIVAGLVVVAIVGTVVAVSVREQSPEAVVESYLDAIRSGDTQAALEIAGEPDDEENRLRFLSADALADDWTVDAVVARNTREDEADVDVTIRAGETARQGRFHVVKGDDGWAMESPFVKVDLAVGDLDVVELGGVRQPVTRDERTRSAPLLLFPGVYELYPSARDRITFDQPLLVATPGASSDTAMQVTAAYTLTDAATDDARTAVKAAVDTCATQKLADPPGCPFDVSENSAIWSLDEVTDIAWTIVTHPEAHVATTRNGSGIELVVRKPGTATVTGTGVPEDGGARTRFTLTCEFGLDNLTADVTMAGVEIGNAVGDDYSAALGTECF